VVAEGVENAAQLTERLTFGCDHGQGFYVAQSLPPDQAEPLIRDRACWLPDQRPEPMTS
jgi:EAL domain-containing protein (putative c-di-GMP-specific phosphodiesterase class I)